MIYQTNFFSFRAVYKSNTFQGGYVSYNKSHIYWIYTLTFTQQDCFFEGLNIPCKLAPSKMQPQQLLYLWHLCVHTICVSPLDLQ